MEKLIISVLGKDRVGIIAKICIYLSENGINILDISQTIIDGYFNMILIVDATKCEKETSVVTREMDELGKEIGLVITVQREEIFNAMHRI